MSQNTIIELLSVTSNAVKALDRTNSSKSSGSGRVTPLTGRQDDIENQAPHTGQSSQDPLDDSRSSGDSGSGRTATASTQGKRGPIINQPKILNSSTTSHGSRCKDLDNFNVAGAEKVKVPKKQLREIVSPENSMENGICSQPEKSGSNSDKAYQQSVKSDQKTIGRTSYFKPENGKIYRPNGVSGKVMPVIKTNVTENGGKEVFPYPRQKTLSDEFDSSAPVYEVEQQRHDSKREFASRMLSGSTAQGDKYVTGNFKSNQNSSLSRFPYKVARHGEAMKEHVLVEPEEPAEEWDDDRSTTSSQPEIVTVTEKVVNISSQAIQMFDDEDLASEDSATDMVAAANRPQAYNHSSKPKIQGPGLRQGALNQGLSGNKTEKGDEVQISKFSLTDRERELRDALSKRGCQSKPVKRVVHPKLVHSSASSVSDDGLNKNNNMDTEGARSASGGAAAVTNVESITAAVAASAAVAATQPFLKMQQDMENKMQSLLAEMERVQKQVGTGGSVEMLGQSGFNPRMEYLEQQVKELTEQRLQHLETLQSQQMELQAHLLSVSRDISHSHRHGQPLASSRHPTYFPTSISQSSAASKNNYNRALIERELMKGRFQGEESSRYGNTGKGGHTAHVEESPLDTPNPRSKPPRPAQFDGAKGGLLQEILASESSPQLNTTFHLPHGQTPPVKLSKTSRRQDGGSPVEKARKLVHDLSNLEEKTAESIWSDRPSGSKLPFKAEEPAPLEYYLKQVRDTKSSPYPKLGKSHRSRSSSPSKSTAGVSKQLNTSYTVVKDTYGDARNVLHSVVTERETLEKNLEMMLRSRQDADVYSLIGEIASDRPEITRIQKIVEKRISSLKNEVKREVEWDLQHNVPATKSASAQEVGRRPGRGASSKAAVGFGSGAPRMSRIDTGLHKSRSVPDTVSAAGKENRIVKAKPAPRQKSKIPYEDEGAMTQIYGKAQYQKGRTTVKDPYLHFQNQTKHRNSRLPSPKRTGDVIDVKSFKAQAGGVTSVHSAGQIEGGKPRQYYFSPTRGYIPLSSEATGPVGGQLVPMAVPLGKPRMDPGLAVVPDDRQQSVSLGVSRPGRSVVTAATNVAMVSVTAQAEQVVRDRVPELGKQVLPAVDIDSLSPASTPCGSDIDIKDPMTSQNAGYLQTFHYQESEEEEEGDKTLTEETSDEEQQGTGISLPGYHQPTPARGGNIPDKATQAAHLADRASQLREQGEVPWEERCDELAEDLRSRDVLQNKAKYWLEQELMARMLMKMYPVMSAQAEQEAEQQQEEDVADGSDSIPDDESLLVGDTIGQRGLQLFVDAGQPVNNKLVNALVREVIAEKVSSILGRRQEIDAADSRTMAAKSRTRPATGGTMVNDEEVIMATNIPNRQPAQVPTPQPTPPCTSPVPGFGAHEIPATPPLTPPPPPLPPRERSPVKDISSESSAPAAVMVSAATSMTAQLEPLPVPQAVPVVYESESEVSASLDISEEIRALEAQMKQAQAASVTQSCHDVRTPTATPPPSPPLPISKERPMATPPASPPSHPAEPVKPSAPVVPQEVPSQERSSKSPQPWGNPDSPGPELNPNYEEPSDVHHSQPQPLMMSVAVGTDRLKEPRRSPSPQRRRTYSTDHSELDSVSSPSSCTDTFNENVSEGQWLISEGQVAGLPPGEEWYHKAVEAVRKMDTSTASTLRDTEDLELDETDIVHSEGEVLSKAGMVNPEKDPVLGLIMQMQRQPGAFRQFDIPAQRVQHVLASTGRSVGEVGRSGGYAAVRRSVGELSEGQVLPGNQVTVVAPKTASAPYPGDEGTDYRQQGDMGMQEADRSLSPGPRRQANSVPRSKTPPGTRNRQQQYQPVRSGLPPSQARRPLKSALVRSSEDSRHSRDSEQEFERRGPPTEYGTRTLTPDQLNTDVLLQSGTYMTRSMGSSGRQGSTKKSVEFDLSGTYEMSRKGSYRGSDDGFNSTAGSSERLSGSGRSLGLKYSFEDSESHREMPSSGLRMSVTIPTTEGASDSDISEIDISESTGI